MEQKAKRGLMGALGFCCVLMALGCASEGVGDESLDQVQQAAVGAGNFGEAASLRLAGFIASTVNSTALSSARFVTAFKRSTTATGRLNVALSRLNADTTLSSIHKLQTNHFIYDNVAVARVDDQHFVVAARGADGKLLVVSFVVDQNDVIQEADSHVRFNVSDVAIASTNISPGALQFGGPAGAAGEGHVVISYRGVNGGLGLLGYSVNQAGMLRATGSVTAGAVPFVNVAYVPGSQPVAAWHSRSSSASERASARCSDGVDNDADGYVDCNDWDCCGNAACDGVGSCVQGTVVTATYNNSTSNKLISWKVSAQGEITRARETLTGAGDTIAIAAQSFRRVATIRASNNFPVISTWNVDNAGALVEHSSLIIPVTSTSVRLVSGGGARLFAQMGNAIGNGYLSTLDAIDQLRETDRMTLPGQIWKNAGSILSLSSDRAVLTFPDASNVVELRAYRDFSQPLVRGSFTFASPNTSTPVNNTSAPLALLSPSTPNPPMRPGADASVAVGGDFVVACGNGLSVIYDKAGNNLTGGAANTLSHSTLFRSVLLPTVTGPGGSTIVNHQSINRHLTFQNLCDGSLRYDKDRGEYNACIEALYDTDCTFDEATQRFVLTSAVRYQNGDPLQRYLAIAVSKETDPRRGFNVYVTTDNKYDDNPAIAANGGMLVFSHQSNSTDHFDSYPWETLAPSAMVFHIADLAASMPEIRGSKVSRWQTGDQMGIAAANSRGQFTVGALYRTIPRKGVQLFVFKKTGAGPLQVVTDDVNYVPGERGDSNAWLQLDATLLGGQPVAAAGKFYVVDDYSDADGTRRVRISGANVTIPRIASGVPLGVALQPMVTVGEAWGCGGSYSCKQSSTALLIPGGRTTGDIYAMYYRYNHRYEACSAGIGCASGVCVGNTCQLNPVRPGVYFTKFDHVLNRQGTAASLIIAGARSISDVADKKIGNSAAIADPRNDSIWGIHAVPDTVGWSYAVGQFR